MKKHYTMKEIVSSYTPAKRKKSSLWARFFSRPISFPLTYLFINLGISANAMSVISIIEELIGFAFILIGGKYFLPIGVGMYVLWHILDCCDGNIARIKGTSSYAGEFFDAVSGYFAPAFIYISVGVAAYQTTTVAFQYRHWFIVLGAFASICDLLSRLVYQKFLVTEYRLDLIGTSGNIDEERAGGLKHMFDIVTKNLAHASLFMPLLILACIFNRYDVLIAFYGVYCFALMLLEVAFFTWKGSKLNQRVAEQKAQKESASTETEK